MSSMSKSILALLACSIPKQTVIFLAFIHSIVIINGYHIFNLKTKWLIGHISLKEISHVRICIGQYVHFKTETFKYVHDCTFKPCRVSSSSDQNSEVGVNSQQDQFSTCRGHQSLEKSFSYRWKMTPGINFTILVSIFNVEKWPPGSIFNVEKWPPGQFSTRVNILRYTGI